MPQAVLAGMNGLTL
jgi:hypothetical protein